MKFKILSRKIKYKGIWASIEEEVIKLPDGKIAKWESVLSEDAVAIVAIDGKKNIYFSKEWRVVVSGEMTQIPAGMCKGKTKKEILKQARNELREEIGFDAKKWEKLGSFILGGRQKCLFHVFLARELFKSPKDPDEGEIIEVVKMPFRKVCRDFLSGKILTTSFSLAALALAKERLKL